MSRRDLLKLAGMTGAAIATAIPGGRALAGSGPDSLAARRAATAASNSPTVSLAAEGRHPLDPLSGPEILVAFTVIESDKRFPNGGVYPIIQLREPPKSEVLSWRPGQQFRREAFANVYDNDSNQLFEVVVDLRHRKIVSWVAKPGVQPAVHDAEYAEADAIVRADPRWVAAMRARKLKPDDVYLDVWAPGDVVIKGLAPNTRCLRALSFFRGKLPNPYDRPVEGVLVTVDMNRRVVVEVLDTGVRPVNTTITGSSSTVRSGLKPLVVTQPKGPSFQLDGFGVTWQGWNFRIGFSPREGLVLHQIGYQQRGAVRPIIYRIAMNEIFVPYAIPDPTWIWRSALDVGEYNLGQLAEPLEAGIDVPDNAVFFDVTAGSDLGSSDGTFDLPHAIALYERNGGVLWDRTDPTSFERDIRNARELVVTSTYVNGNYTYATEFIFRMDGGIDVHVNATGTTLNRGVRSAEEGAQFGTLVAPGIAAPTHQHFFNFRIDFDVDGTPNRVVEENVRSVASPGSNAFVVDETPLTVEQSRDLNPATYRRWKIESTTKANAVGEPTAYGLEPGEFTVPYSSPSLPALLRAPLAQHPFWVTRYREGEIYSVGDYPNQGQPGDGLTAYASSQQSIDGADVVVWYTASFTHIPEVENYPVMATETIKFALCPSGFFDQAPALDAP